jgi:RuvB-like protein 1 (pontin 52)
MAAMGKPKDRVTDKVASEINKVVTKYIDQAWQNVPRYCLLLKCTCWIWNTYLNRSLESPISPIVVLATNRGVTKILGYRFNVAARHSH